MKSKDFNTPLVRPFISQGNQNRSQKCKRFAAPISPETSKTLSRGASTFLPGPSKSSPPMSTFLTGPSKNSPPMSTFLPVPSKISPPMSTFLPVPSKISPPMSTFLPGPSKISPPMSTFLPGPSKTSPPMSTFLPGPSNTLPDTSTLLSGPSNTLPPRMKLFDDLLLDLPPPPPPKEFSDDSNLCCNYKYSSTLPPVSSSTLPPTSATRSRQAPACADVVTSSDNVKQFPCSVDLQASVETKKRQLMQEVNNFIKSGSKSLALVENTGSSEHELLSQNEIACCANEGFSSMKDSPGKYHTISISRLQSRSGRSGMDEADSSTRTKSAIIPQPSSPSSAVEMRRTSDTGTVTRDSLLADLKYTLSPSEERRSVAKVSDIKRLSSCSSGSDSTEIGHHLQSQSRRSHSATPPAHSQDSMQELDALLNDLNDAGYAAVYRPASNGAPTVAPPSEFSGGKSRTGGGVPHRDQTVALARMDQPDNVIGHGVGDGGRGDDSLHSYETRTVTVTESVPDGYKAAVSATEELDQLMSSLSDFKIHSTSRHHTVIEESEPVYARPLRSADQLDSMLGKLRNDMDKQGVDTLTDKGTCAGCDKPIAGQVITALDKSWHPEHFTCAHCRQELANKSFFERDGLPYCETDYHNLFSPRCAYCNGPILDKCVTALQQTWHPEHFFCAHCGEPFGDGGFHERDGRPYCQRDYFQLFAAKCGGCQQPIMENYITALGGQWHPHCFVCKDCKRSFESGSFFDHEGQPYCETHYHAKRGSLCAGCNKPITGRCITAMFRKFHPEHFVCTFCLKQLNKGTFKEQADKPYCHTCFDKLFG